MTSIFLLHPAAFSQLEVTNALARIPTTEDGDQVQLFDDLVQMIAALSSDMPELLVIEARDPDDTVRLCQEVRNVNILRDIPILGVVRMGEAEQIARILDAGADDCLRKPLNAGELAARLRALKRRPAQTTITLFPDLRSVKAAGKFVKLTVTEFDLLRILCEKPNEPKSATTLLQTVWHYPVDVGNEALVRNHIRNLRRKVERDPNAPHVIMSAHGRGYYVNGVIRSILTK